MCQSLWDASYTQTMRSVYLYAVEPLLRPHHFPLLPADPSTRFSIPFSLSSSFLFTMATAPHSVQLPHRGPRQHTPTTTVTNSPTKPRLLQPELLLKIATFCDRTVDLQNLRLVNRAFSKAATTTLQDRFVRIYLSPTRTSVARFSKLAQNALIAPKIKEVVVLYRPPYASTVSPSCQTIAEQYGMPWQKGNDIVSE